MERKVNSGSSRPGSTRFQQDRAAQACIDTQIRTRVSNWEDSPPSTLWRPSDGYPSKAEEQHPNYLDSSVANPSPTGASRASPAHLVKSLTFGNLAPNSPPSSTEDYKPSPTKALRRDPSLTFLPSGPGTPPGVSLRRDPSLTFSPSPLYSPSQEQAAHYPYSHSNDTRRFASDYDSPGLRSTVAFPSELSDSLRSSASVDSIQNSKHQHGPSRPTSTTNFKIPDAGSQPGRTTKRPSGTRTPRRPHRMSPDRSASPGSYGSIWGTANAAWGNAHTLGFALSPMIGGDIDTHKIRRMRSAADFYRGGRSPCPRKFYQEDQDYSSYNDSSQWKDQDISGGYDPSSGFRKSVANSVSSSRRTSYHGSPWKDRDISSSKTVTEASYSYSGSRESMTSKRSRKKAGYRDLESTFGALGDLGEVEWSPKTATSRSSNVDSLKSGISESISRNVDSKSSHLDDEIPSYESDSEAYKSSDDEDQKKSVTVGFFELFKFAGFSDWMLMLFGSVGAVVNGGSLPWYSLLFGDLVNSLALQKNKEDMIKEVQKTCVYMVILAVAVLFATYAEVACWMLAADRQASRIRSKYLRAVLRQDVSYFDGEISTADAMNSISRDVAIIQDAIGEKVGNFIHHLSSFIMGYIVGCLKSWQVSLVVLAATPLMMICGKIQRAAYIDLASKEEAAYEEAGHLAEQTVSAIRTVYTFVAEDGLESRYSAFLQNTIPYGLLVGFARGAGIGFIYLTSYGTWALALWYSSVLVARGTLLGGDAITTLFAVITGGKGLGLALPYLANFAEGGVAAARVFAIMKRKPLIDIDDVNGEIPETVRGDVHFQRVNFSYPSRPGIQILKDFTIRMPAGKSVALVGPSGGGKSTVFALLERFYDPDAGVVIVDGLDIQDLQLAWLRRQIGMVGQEPVLYATTIAQNILYGKDGARMADVKAAAKAANAHDFISKLPDGYDTQVGERGVQMSGGQKQRIAIARAILKNPRILLLDEATSALDSESEHLVQEALDRMLAGRTTIVIAHRLSTIRDMDIIAVVQDGKVIEMGNHEKLLEKRGPYRALVTQSISSMVGNGGTSGLCSAYVTPETTPIHAMAGGASLSPLKKSVQVKSPALKSGQSIKKTTLGDPEHVSFSRLFKMSMEELPLLTVGLFNAINAGLIFPFFGLIMGIVVSVYFLEDKQKMRREVNVWAGVFIALGIAAIISMTGQHGFCNWAGIKLTKRIRELLFRSLLRQEVGWYDKDENSSGAVIARLSVDAAYIRGMVGDRLSILAMGITAIGAGLVICLVLQWKMTLVSIAVTPFFIGASYAGAMLQVGLLGRDDDYASASSIASDAVSNIRTVASFSSEDKIVDLFNRALSVPMKKSLRRAQITGCSLGLSQCLMYASYTLTLWYGSILVQKGETGFDRVIKVFLILILSSFSVGQISQMAPDSSKSAAAVRSVFSVIDRKPLVDANLNQKEGRVHVVTGSIELIKVDFAYPARPEIAIFSGFSLKIKAGSTMALVGPSGCGKSTVISLLLRFYDPLRGKILLDGVDLRALNGKWLRSQMALVGQEPVLFATTIRENIAFGRERTSMAEIELAARTANVHEFICSLTNGYNTQVGERGVQLSGGQKQRIAIARAVVRNPKIFLLDEATSALDVVSEVKVHQALEKVIKARTTIIIAHRLSTIRDADGIGVVKNGKVVELGNHNRLMEKAGEYFALVSSQTQGQ